VADDELIMIIIIILLQAIEIICIGFFFLTIFSGNCNYSDKESTSNALQDPQQYYSQVPPVQEGGYEYNPELVPPPNPNYYEMPPPPQQQPQVIVIQGGYSA